ncbi:hypothetical protein PR048_014464 [Dryococelus australis]|uniref:Uncharacterized protein n=1 Tax=Dryococelus australis TaxID=614101 RepID=A0ABQ9HEJ1_9NEOP|nr:hypothetical protein PR048_014464 [Dryococelus australis]
MTAPGWHSATQTSLEPPRAPACVHGPERASILRSQTRVMGPSLQLACEWSECIQLPWAARWLLAPAACTENVQPSTINMPRTRRSPISVWHFTCRVEARQIGERLQDAIVSQKKIPTSEPRPFTQGAAVAERLDCSPQTKENRVQPPAGDASGRWVFSGISRFPRPCIPALLQSHLISPSPALKTSSLRAAQISQLNLTLIYGRSIRNLRRKADCKHRPLGEGAVAPAPWHARVAGLALCRGVVTPCVTPSAPSRINNVSRRLLHPPPPLSTFHAPLLVGSSLGRRRRRGGGDGRIAERAHQPAASSATIPTCEISERPRRKSSPVHLGAVVFAFQHGESASTSDWITAQILAFGKRGRRFLSPEGCVVGFQFPPSLNFIPPPFSSLDPRLVQVANSVTSHNAQFARGSCSDRSLRAHQYTSYFILKTVRDKSLEGLKRQPIYFDMGLKAVPEGARCSAVIRTLTEERSVSDDREGICSAGCKMRRLMLARGRGCWRHTAVVSRGLERAALADEGTLPGNEANRPGLRAAEGVEIEGGGEIGEGGRGKGDFGVCAQSRARARPGIQIATDARSLQGVIFIPEARAICLAASSTPASLFLCHSFPLQHPAGAASLQPNRQDKQPRGERTRAFKAKKRGSDTDDTITRTPSASSLLRTRRAVFPSWSCTVKRLQLSITVLYTRSPSWGFILVASTSAVLVHCTHSGHRGQHENPFPDMRGAVRATPQLCESGHEPLPFPPLAQWTIPDEHSAWRGHRLLTIHRSNTDKADSFPAPATLTYLPRLRNLSVDETLRPLVCKNLTEYSDAKDCSRGATSGPAMVPAACQLLANFLPGWHPTRGALATGVPLLMTGRSLDNAGPTHFSDMRAELQMNVDALFSPSNGMSQCWPLAQPSKRHRLECVCQLHSNRSPRSSTGLLTRQQTRSVGKEATKGSDGINGRTPRKPHRPRCEETALGSAWLVSRPVFYGCVHHCKRYIAVPPPPPHGTSGVGTEQGGTVVTHWTHIRDDTGSIPGPAILISAFRNRSRRMLEWVSNKGHGRCLPQSLFPAQLAHFQMTSLSTRPVNLKLAAYQDRGTEEPRVQSQESRVISDLNVLHGLQPWSVCEQTFIKSMRDAGLDVDFLEGSSVPSRILIRILYPS